MKKRLLGQSGLEVSAIGLGCMSFAGFYGETNEAESFECLQQAHDAGITFLDTARIYGQGLSETIIGKYQKETGQKFVIATKGGIVEGGNRGDTDNSEPFLRAQLEGSLERLQVDQVALYYVHRRDWSIDIEDVTETLETFRQEGLIGGFGFSEIAPNSLRKASRFAPVMAVQNEYSLWTRYPDLGLIRACDELGTTFVPFSPLGRGMFTETNPDPSKFGAKDIRQTQPRFLGENFDANCKLVQAFRDYCESKGWHPSAAALAWCLDQADHIIPIPGTRSAGHLRDLVAGANIEFSQSDRIEIDTLLPPGFAHGDRYSDPQLVGIERYC